MKRWSVSNKTVIESSIKSSQTVIEGSLKTIIEDSSLTPNPNLHLSTFQDYTIIEQFPTSGSEADIYLVEKEAKKYVLKLYRFGLEPKREVVEKLKFLSDNHPKDIVKIYEIEFDQPTKRWYEIQEYIEHGSLEDYKKQTLNQDELKQVLVEIARMLHSIHAQNIIHRDLKPDNILIRHKEPLELVMTDFGISSVLDSEFSKRMTSKSGTKIYFAPESFSGVIGKEVDYWALGMILLELASGDNIFKELDENYIAYAISTKNVPIPKDIESDFAYLLKGLLTRDPDNRWGHSEIVRWLKGDRDIALEYHSSEGEYEKPYVINGKKYYDLSELVSTFATSPKAWEEGKAHLYRGYITKWLENNNDFDRSIKIDALKKSKDDDFALFKLIYTYNHDLDFIIGGKLINANNLMHFMGKYINDECNSQEESIVHAVLTGKILDYYQIYTDSTGNGDDFGNILQSIVKYYEDNNFYAMEKIKDIMQFLKIASEKEQYYFSYDILMAHDDLLIKREDFDRVAQRFTLPQEIIDMVQSHRFNRKSIKYLRKLLDFDYEAHYLPVDFNEKLQNDFENTINSLEHFIPKKLFDQKVKEAFVPAFFKAQIQNAPMEEYLHSAQIFRELEALGREEYAKLQNDYYIPPIDTNITQEEFEHFTKQVSLINDLIVEGLLISKESLTTLASLVPQSIQKSIQKGEYDHEIAEGIHRLKQFDTGKYILPDTFHEQLQSSFFKVTSNLDKFLKRSDYEHYFVPNRIKVSLLKSSFANYLSLSQLISEGAMGEEYLKELRQDQEFLNALKLNLDNLNEIDEKTLLMIQKIKKANVNRAAYIQMMAIDDKVKKSKSDKIKKYFKELQSFNKEWNRTDSKIIEYIYNYKITIKTTFENISYNGFDRYTLLTGKFSLASFLFWFGARSIENPIYFYTMLAFYIPAATVMFLRHDDIRFIQIYTNPFQIVLDNIDRNSEFIRRVDWVVR